jgi:hypothetical protein
VTSLFAVADSILPLTALICLAALQSTFTRNEAWRIAANIAKLPALVRAGPARDR